MKQRTILFAWELGGGLGHLLRFRRIAERLAAAGHRVLVVLRDLSQAHRLFPAPGIELLQAPIKTGPSPERFALPSTFAHVLFNMAFGNVDELCALVRAWRTLVQWAEPDLIVFDHSPTALLATRGYGAKRVLIGNGFCCPAVCSRFPDWRPWEHNDPDQLQRDEDRVLGNANRVLEESSCPRLRRLSDLYRDVDETVLTTFAELDPFGDRGPDRYWGVWSVDLGVPPPWPADANPRVFAYIKPSPMLPAILEAIRAIRIPAVIFCPEVQPQLRQRFSDHRLSFCAQPVDVRQAADGCDLAILNATLNTTATMLLAGKPLLLVPLQLEQRLTAERVAAIGAGRFVLPNHAHEIAVCLQDMLASTRYALAAKQFAEKYVGFAGGDPAGRATERLFQLLAP